MNLSKRLCCAFLLCALLCVQYSPLCYASETVTNSSYQYDNYAIMPLDYVEDTPSNGGLNANLYTKFFNSSWSSLKFNQLALPSVGSSYSGSLTTNDNLLSYMQSVSYFAGEYKFSLADKTKFAKEGSDFNIQLSGLYFSYREYGEYSNSSSNGSTWYSDYTFKSGNINPLSSISFIKVNLFDSNNKQTLLDTIEKDDVIKYLTYNSNGTFVIDYDFTDIPFDVYGISFEIVMDNTWIVPSGIYSSYPRYLAFTLGFQSSNFILQEPDETKGLLASIIDWLRSIKNGITDVFDSITALPGRIWSFIENGIKTLFVPSSDDIVAMKDQWDTLLSDRFGVVYQSGSLIIDTVKTITAQAGNPNIEFPQVTYNFSGSEFTFGGYNVQVVPTGFEFLADVLKTVIDIVVTLAFVNGMRNKYDELMMR